MDPILLAYILIAVGVVLVLAELFVPSGFILVAIGICCAFIGVGLLFVHGSTETALTALLSLCVGGPLLGGLVFYLWPYSPMGRKLIKAAEQDATIASMPANLELEALRGKIGRAVSPLRPSGVAEFDGRRIDVITEGLMVEPGQWVKCVEVRANKVLVRPADPPKLEDFETASFS
jgi:membrane-bound serine protease (ClpP class)